MDEYLPVGSGPRHPVGEPTVKDKERAAIKGRVKRYLRKWEGRLGMLSWTRSYDWRDEPIEPCAEGDAYQVGARTFAEWQYLHVHYKLYLPALAKLDDEDLEELIVHEFMHTGLDELVKSAGQPDAAMHEERVVVWLTRCYLHLANNPFPIPKPKEKKCTSGAQNNG